MTHTHTHTTTTTYTTTGESFQVTHEIDIRHHMTRTTVIIRDEQGAIMHNRMCVVHVQARNEVHADFGWWDKRDNQYHIHHEDAHALIQTNTWYDHATANQLLLYFAYVSHHFVSDMLKEWQQDLFRATLLHA